MNTKWAYILSGAAFAVWMLVLVMLLYAFAGVMALSSAHADDVIPPAAIEECFVKGKIARLLAHEVKEGSDPSTIQFAFTGLTEDMLPAWEKTVASARDYFGLAMAERSGDIDPNHIGARVAEMCAYDYGKYRSNAGGFVKVASSEHIKDIDGLWLRVEGCFTQRHLYFQKCIDREHPSVVSQNDIWRVGRSCKEEMVQKFFDCATLYPRPTLTEEINKELDVESGN